MHIWMNKKNKAESLISVRELSLSSTNIPDLKITHGSSRFHAIKEQLIYYIPPRIFYN